MKSSLKTLFLLGICVFGTLSCQPAADGPPPQIEKDLAAVDEANLAEAQKLEIKKFKFGQVRPLPDVNRFKDALNKASLNITKRPNIYMFFVDTLRKDHITPELAPNMYKFMQDNVSFKYSVSASPVTHLASFSIFYSQPAYMRNTMLKPSSNPWLIGSPFLNILKRLGYTLNAYGSVWQYCIDLDPILKITDPRIMNDYVEPNLLLLYGRRSLDLLDTCYNQGFFKGGKDPYVVLGLPSRNPEVAPSYRKESAWLSPNYVENRFTGLIKNLLPSETRELALFKKAKLDVIDTPSAYGESDPGVVDELVINDTFKKIDEQKETEGRLQDSFYLIYLFAVHDQYSFSKSPEFLKTAHLDEPFLPFDPLSHAKKLDPKDDHPPAEIDAWRRKMKNSYRNAVRGADYQFGRFINKLKDLGEYDDAMIVLFSDHGEFLFDDDLKPGDNDRVGHCCNTYKVNTDVPIVFKFPKGDAKLDELKDKNKKIVSHVDIYPTILDFLGLNAYDKLAEQSFVGQSIFRHQRNCAITFNPFGYRFSIVGDDGTKITLLIDKPNDIFNGGGVIFESLKTYDDVDLPATSFQDLDQQKVFNYVYSNYPDCLNEVFTLNLNEAQYVENLDTVYKRALETAANKGNLKLANDRLFTVNSKNPKIKWQPPLKDKVLVATLVTPDQKFERLMTSGETKYSLPREFWVTVVPELQDFCSRSGFRDKKLSMRLKQYLGIRPKSKYSAVLEFWVSTKKLVRACSDPNIETANCQQDPGLAKPQEHQDWLKKTQAVTGANFPFTGFGYTYDWGAVSDYVGASEFVIAKNTSVTLEKISSFDEYCDPFKKRESELPYQE